MPDLRLRSSPSRRALGVTVVATALALSGACRERAAAVADSTSPPGTVRDDYGIVVRLAAPPQRIVSLTPATTELLFAIGAGPRVVGRTQYDLWPDSAKLVPNVGAGMQPNLEAVLARRPDLVILYASGADRASAERLTAAGVPTAAFRFDKIRDFQRVTLLPRRPVAGTARPRTGVRLVTPPPHPLHPTTPSPT